MRKVLFTNFALEMAVLLFSLSRTRVRMDVMRNNKRTQLTVIGAAVALSLAFVPATAATAATTPNAAQIDASTTSSTAITLAEFEAEIAALEGYSEAELKEIIEASVAAHEGRASGDIQTMALPAVPLIVWGIGCGVAGIGSVATNAWGNSESAAWALAGILTGCLPGVAQANIVKTILANKGAIANALKAVGLTAPALALSGDSSS